MPDLICPVVTDLPAPIRGAGRARRLRPVRHVGVKPGHPAHASDRLFISLDLSPLPYAPRHGDRLLRVATGQFYHVADIQPSTPGFSQLDLNKI